MILPDIFLAACGGGDSSRRRTVTVAAAVVMAALGLLVLVALVLLAATPALITGRATAPPDQPQPSLNAVKGESFRQAQPVAPQAAKRSVLPEPPGLLVMDVDAGADDAMAVLLVLRQEELAAGRGEAGAGPRLLAVTCTHGNTALSNVEHNVLKTLHLAERLDIPVYSGAAGSLLTTPPGDDFFGLDGFGDFEYEDAPNPKDYLQKEHAVHALIRLAKEYPGQITILATGPLSNIALAVRIDPNFLTNIKQLIVMGGSSDGSGNIKPATEFNFFLDPEANFIVFNSTLNESKPIFVVPWDAVAKNSIVSMDWRLEVLGQVQSKYMDFLNKAERKAIEADLDTGLWICADPIAAALLLRPDLITASEQHHVNAETHGDYARGVIFVDYNDELSPKNSVIVKSFNVSGYKDLLLRNLS